MLLACDGGRAVGFVQLFASFSFARLARLFILNDLFVSSDARGMGAARALLDGACEYGQSVGAARLSLSIAVTNTTAQSLGQAVNLIIEDVDRLSRDAEHLHYMVKLFRLHQVAVLTVVAGKVDEMMLAFVGIIASSSGCVSPIRRGGVSEARRRAAPPLAAACSAIAAR
ncbi:GNAT family N-acetyltransferase [uncultured Sphingomonas sp.]|uniref:GNAT family N-acetyltransferase n=1 Tax=uncultured Sphingomonas sp. TaxID=158754 RepID=UPI0025D4AB11|nr:GNAT family N-acetyltransferase [uncultured Sphingomonas sp.]